MSLLEAQEITRYAHWQALCVISTAHVQQAAEILEREKVKIVLVVKDLYLIGTISDGDVRRGLLKGVSLHDSVELILNPAPLVAPQGFDKKTALQLMKSNGVEHLPTLDEAGLLCGLLTRQALLVSRLIQNTMVIMAGGLGTRLRPHTETCPKPLLMVAGKPMLEHIIERARADGFSQFVIALGYLGHMIKAHFGDGQAFGVKIEYIEEQQPLGTAGALGLMAKPQAAFVVTNGDVMTDISYQQLLQFHQHQKAKATMAVCLHEWRNPFGVVNIDNGDIVGFEEKPIARSYINAGVYVLEPSCLSLIPKGISMDMPDLFEILRGQGATTVAYPMHEPWIDVGRPSDWHKANSSQVADQSTLKPKGFE